MTSEPPAAPGPWQQTNAQGGTGFQGGEHHHHYPDAPGPQAAVQASIRATDEGPVIGRPVGKWAANLLGVHDSITVHNETTLTPYIPRSHDQELRDRLHNLTAPNAANQFVLVVGTSCTGKTRTLYEAVRTVLPDWPLVAPRNDTELTNLLNDGVPAGTVVWLDEIQRHLTKSPHGIHAAKAITALTGSDRVGRSCLPGPSGPPT